MNRSRKSAFLLGAMGVAMSGDLAADEVRRPIAVAVQKWRSKSWRSYETVGVGHLADYKGETVTTGRFGGRTDRREEATGSFYVGRAADQWMLIDPEGYHFLSCGVNSTAPNDTNKDTADAFRQKYGSVEEWAKRTRALLVDQLGFNTLGCWSSWADFKGADVPMPYTRRWNMMASYAKKRGSTHYEYGHTGFAGDCIPVFDPEFVSFCDGFAARLAETKDDPWLLGHFSDNELPLKRDRIIARYLSLPAKDPGHVAAEAWLRERGKSKKQVTPADDGEFCELVIGRYYRIASAAIKRHDPNHLFLGSRFHGGVSKQDETYRACGPYVDVVSVNYYHRWTPEQDALDRWSRLAGKPILITEWYAKGADSGLSNEAGAGFTVRTQAHRGLFYENYVIGLLRNPHVVGWHWFRYIDDGPSKRGGSSNKGILNLDYEPYAPLSDSMTAVNSNVYSLRDYLLKAAAPHLADGPREIE